MGTSESYTLVAFLRAIFFKDHAPGKLIVEEAGGVVTDSRGEPLNFGWGRTLGENYGVIASAKAVHPKVLKAVQKALAESSTTTVL